MSSNADLAVLKKNEGNEAFKARDYDTAIARYSEAIELDPTNHVFYSNRSMAYAGKGAWEPAAADGKMCVQLNGSFMKGYHRAANALGQLGQFAEAVAITEKGLIHHPGNADLTALLEHCRAQRDAAEAKRRAAMAGPELLKEQANDLFKAARFEEAIPAYTKALEACEDQNGTLALKIRNNRAACYQQLSAYQKVVDDTTHVLEFEPKNLKALIRRGLALEALERFRMALSDIRAALAIDPGMDIANRAQHRIGATVRALKKEKKAI
jgi:stress-induced-phosphoprotein 1